MKLTNHCPCLFALMITWCAIADRAVADDAPEFSKLLVFEKWLMGSLHADSDGGVLFTATISTTNHQSFGSNSFSGQRPLVIGRLNRQRDLEWHVTVATSNTSPRPLAVTRDSSSNVLCLAYAYYSTSQTGILSVAGQPVFLSTGVSPEAVLIKLTPAGAVSWGRSTGLIFKTISYSAGLATDSTDAVLVVQDRAAGMTTNCVLKKFSSDGTLLWSLFTESGAAIGTAVATAPDDDIFLSGIYDNSFTLDGVLLTNNSGRRATFVARLDPQGQLRWIKSSGAGEYSWITSCAVDSLTNVVVCGITAATNLFGLPNSRGQRPAQYFGNSPQQGFAAKLSADGQTQWVHAAQDGFPEGDLSPAASSSFVAIITDPEGGIYLGGGFGDGTIAFGGDSLTSAGISDVLMAKLDSAGKVLWTRRGGATRPDGFIDIARGLAATPDGLWVCGEFSAPSANFGNLSAQTGQPPVAHGGEPSGFFTLLPHPAPPLATELTGGDLKLSWPTFPPEFELETATALGAPTLWSSNSVPVTIANGTNSVTLPMDSPARYFRLRKPIP